MRSCTSLATVVAGFLALAGAPCAAESGDEISHARLPKAANSTPMTYPLEEGGVDPSVVSVGRDRIGFTPVGECFVDVER